MDSFSSLETLNQEVKPEVTGTDVLPGKGGLKMEKQKLLDFLIENFGQILQTKDAQDVIKNATGESISKLLRGRPSLRKDILSKHVRQLKQQNKDLTDRIDKMDQSDYNKTLRVTGLEESEEKTLAEAITTFTKDRLQVDL